MFSVGGILPLCFQQLFMRISSACAIAAGLGGLEGTSPALPEWDDLSVMIDADSEFAMKWLSPGRRGIQRCCMSRRLDTLNTSELGLVLLARPSNKVTQSRGTGAGAGTAGGNVGLLGCVT